MDPATVVIPAGSIVEQGVTYVALEAPDGSRVFVNAGLVAQELQRMIQDQVAAEGGLVNVVRTRTADHIAKQVESRIGRVIRNALSGHGGPHDA